MKKIPMMNLFTTLAASACFLLMTSVTSAAITYVDAVEGAAGNTTLLDGTVWNSTAAAAHDGLWRNRAFGNGGTIYEADAFETNEDAHMLITTIGGLTPGASYDVFTYFWRDPSNWRIKSTINTADIDENGTIGDLSDDFLPSIPAVNFTALGPPATSTIVNLALAGDFGVAPLLAEGNRELVQANLGSIAANASGDILVYIDDGDNLLSNGRRTWYDGVGYQPAAIPEPTSLVLLGLSGIALLRGRR